MIHHLRSYPLNSQTDLFSCEKPPELYSCPHCYYESDLSIVLKEHSSSLHKNEESKEVEDYTFSIYDCETCKFQTFSILIMLKHVTGGCAKTRERKTTKPYECDQCPYASSRKNNLNTHKIYKHTSPKDIKWLECDRCEKKFKTVTLLRAHVKRKHEIEWFHCAQCPYRTNHKICLRRHTYRKHSDPSEIRWFVCDQCSYRSKNKSDLKAHVGRIHLGLEKKARFVCGQCSYVGKHKHHLNSHIISKHSSAEIIKRHKCDKCPYSTKLKGNLNVHRLHKHTSPEDIKWLECDRCELKFKTTNLLRWHVKQTHEIEWFKCAQCPYKTVNRGNFWHHNYIKHSDPKEIKWFDCDKCSYRSKYKSSLKKHVIRIHLGGGKTARFAYKE